MRIRAFRDSYIDGVHSYLDGLKEQMELAKDLLHENGSFVMQIGPDNLHQVAILMSEVFGSENHVATIPYRTTTNPSAQLLPEIGNWLIWFAKDKQKTKYHQLYEARNDRKAIIDYWQHRARFETDTGELRALTEEERADPNNIVAAGQIFMTYPCYSDSTSFSGRSDTYYHHENDQPCSARDGQRTFGKRYKSSHIVIIPAGPANATTRLQITGCNISVMRNAIAQPVTDYAQRGESVALPAELMLTRVPPVGTGV